MLCRSWKCVPTGISGGVDISEVTDYHNRWVLSKCHKHYVKDWCLINSQPTILILTFWKSVEWPYYQKDINQINLHHTALWNLALPMFEVFIVILLNVNLSLNQALMSFLLHVKQTWMTPLTVYMVLVFMWRKDFLLHRIYL